VFDKLEGGGAGGEAGPELERKKRDRRGAGERPPAQPRSLRIRAATAATANGAKIRMSGA